MKALYIVFQSFKFEAEDEEIAKALNETGECPEDVSEEDCFVSLHQIIVNTIKTELLELIRLLIGFIIY